MPLNLRKKLYIIRLQADYSLQETSLCLSATITRPFKVCFADAPPCYKQDCGFARDRLINTVSWPKFPHQIKTVYNYNMCALKMHIFVAICKQQRTKAHIVCFNTHFFNRNG